MKQLNLEAKTKEQQRIKAYLEENASDILAANIAVVEIPDHGFHFEPP